MSKYHNPQNLQKILFALATLYADILPNRTISKVFKQNSDYFTDKLDQQCEFFIGELSNMALTERQAETFNDAVSAFEEFKKTNLIGGK